MMQDMDSLSMGILQVRLLEWVAMPSSRGSSQYRDQTCISCIAGRFFTNWATWKAQLLYYYLLKKKKKLPASSWSPCPSWDCPLHSTAAYIPQRFVGLPAHHASPESPGLWMRGPDSAHWTTGCGKETARVKGWPISALTKQGHPVPPPLKKWHLLWATFLTCLFLTGKCSYTTTKGARVVKAAEVPWSTIWCDFQSVGKPFSLALHSHGHLMVMTMSF